MMTKDRMHNHNRSVGSALADARLREVARSRPLKRTLLPRPSINGLLSISARAAGPPTGGLRMPLTEDRR